MPNRIRRAAMLFFWIALAAKPLKILLKTEYELVKSIIRAAIAGIVRTIAFHLTVIRTR
jgi:hypothetical protein